ATLDLRPNRPVRRYTRERQPALADVHDARATDAPVARHGERRGRGERRARVLARAGRHNAVDLHWPRLALDRDVPELARRELSLHELVCVLADDDRRAVVLRRGLEPRAEIDVVAERGVLEALLGAQRAHQHLAGVDPHAD